MTAAAIAATAIAEEGKEDAWRKTKEDGEIYYYYGDGYDHKDKVVIDQGGTVGRSRAEEGEEENILGPLHKGELDFSHWWQNSMRVGEGLEK